MPEMTEVELHQKVDTAVKQAIREAVARKRALKPKTDKVVKVQICNGKFEQQS